MSKKILVAHRGAPYFAHENTMGSFLKAVETGCDMIEFDVRRTKDGALVVHHDPYIYDLHKKVHICQLTFSGLQEIALKMGYSIPKVEQVLKKFSGRTTFDIELKEESCERDLIQLVNTHTSPSQCVFTSFNHDIICSLKAINPELKTGILLPGIKSAYKKTPADFLCIRKSVFTTFHSFFRSAREKGKLIAIWTVGGNRLLKRLFDDPIVDAIITSRIDRAVKIQHALSFNQV